MAHHTPAASQSSCQPGNWRHFKGGTMKALLATLMFAVVLAPLASAAQKPAAKAMKASGTVVSASDTSLVITSSKTKKESTFVLNADTKKQGNLTAGAKVAVSYTMSGKDMVASSVTASGGAATTASTSSGAKTKSKKPAN
jgi:hypothetical protein